MITPAPFSLSISPTLTKEGKNNNKKQQQKTTTKTKAHS